MPPIDKPIITIGIPCYQGVGAETLCDYMRFAYYLGRRYQEYDFFLAIKSKSEQFRARNNIVEAAIQVGSRYLLMLDDDHMIDTEDTVGPTEKYDFLHILLAHMKGNPKTGIIGCLYYTRGGDCRPVIMLMGENGKHYWIRDEQIEYKLQEVSVQGGGIMLMDMRIFDDIPSPWFEPELEFGTDFQISIKANKYGWKILSDTSIEIGHVMSRRDVLTSKTRHRIWGETIEHHRTDNNPESKYLASNSLAFYREDAEEYLGMTIDEMVKVADEYQENIAEFPAYENKDEYYKSRGNGQLARQVLFHHSDAMVQQLYTVLSLVQSEHKGYGLEYGCGSSPVGFEIAMQGHQMDLVDIDGTAAYEFTKWRTKKRGLEKRIAFEMKGPYDFVLFLDAIEHFQDWKSILKNAVDRIKTNGCIITNYFFNKDYNNKEHINMDKRAVWDELVRLGVYPLNNIVWIKRDLSEIGKKPEPTKIEERQQCSP